MPYHRVVAGETIKNIDSPYPRVSGRRNGQSLRVVNGVVAGYAATVVPFLYDYWAASQKYGEVLMLDPVYRIRFLSMFVGFFVGGFIFGCQFRRPSIWSTLCVPSFCLYALRVPQWFVGAGIHGYWILLGPLTFLPGGLAYGWIMQKLQEEKRLSKSPLENPQRTDEPMPAISEESLAMSLRNQAPSNLTDRPN